MNPNYMKEAQNSKLFFLYCTHNYIEFYLYVIHMWFFQQIYIVCKNYFFGKMYSFLSVWIEKVCWAESSCPTQIVTS